MRPGRSSPPGVQAADLYDYVYSWKDYAGEAAAVRQILAERGIADGARVLEVACGTGRYLEHLQRWYAVWGLDLDPQMLRQAGWRAPSAALLQADMADFSLPEPADALLCLFGGVGYLPPERLAAGCAAFCAALRPGGIALVEPWVTPEAFVPGQPWLQTSQSPGFHLARAVVPRREGARCVLDFHYLLARAALGVVELQQQEVLHLHSLDQVVAHLEEAGFEVEITARGFMPDRYLAVARRLAPAA